MLVRMRQAPVFALLAAVSLCLASCDDFSRPATAHRAAPSAALITPIETTSTEPKAPGASAPGAPGAPDPITPAGPGPTAAARVSPALPPSATPAASLDPRAQAIETSGLAASPGAKPGQPLLVKLEVLLDRAHFSPGPIDGRQGENLRGAIVAFQTARGLPATGKVNASLLRTLSSADTGPVTEDYVIAAEDEKGPFLGAVPTGFQALSKLKYVGYATPLEGLAEKFHMSQALLRTLNPKADFARAGSPILVVRPGSGDLAAKVATVVVDKTANQVRALDGGGKILAAFPATVGSTERPAPSGAWAVKTVVHGPDYTYDPRRLTFGDRSKGALRIAPGPNNPVGSTWIALTAPTYGIHGMPDPVKVGKTASHGCVRLTNWDVALLGRSVAKGTPVMFVGKTAKS